MGKVAPEQVQKCSYASVSSKINEFAIKRLFWERQMTRKIRLINDE